MNTPAHLIVAAAAFADPDRPRVTLAALVGGFLPDASLYFLYLWARLVRGASDRQIFGEFYFSAAWQSIFAIDNSFFVWGLFLGLAMLVKNRIVFVFAIAGLLHVALDFPLHHDDGRAHFWPLTDWIFESPISYWDPRHHGQIVGTLEVILCLILLAVLWRRFSGRFARTVIAGSAGALVAPTVIFSVMFS